MKTLKKPDYILQDRAPARPLWVLCVMFLGMICLAVYGERLALAVLNAFRPATGTAAAARSLFATLICIGAVFLFALRIERRGCASLSLRLAPGTRFSREYLLGLLSGAGLFSLTVLLGTLTGAVSLSRANGPVNAGTLLLFFCGYLIQGFSEELTCRGYLLGGLIRTVPLPMAVLLSSLTFSAMHLFNEGVTVTALVNITLFGVFTALLTLRRGSLWAAAGLHSAWNYVQGPVFGVPVSGNVPRASVFLCALRPEKTLLNGGGFGLEGGLCVTFVLCLAIAFTLLGMEQKR